MTPRNYLFTLTDAGGTVPPELGVVRRLAARGHRIRVLAEDVMAAEVEATGARFLPWRTAPNRSDPDPATVAYRDWETRNPLRLARGMADHMLAGPAPQYAADTLAAVDADRPDRIVTSFTAFGAMIGAETARVPFDVLIPNIYPMPARGMPPMGAGLRPRTGVLGRQRDRLANALSTGMLNRLALPRINAARLGHGLTALGSLWDQVHRAAHELVLTSTAFDFPSEPPGNVRYVGPILDDPEWTHRTEPQYPPGDAPLVLVAMSSTFQDQTAVLQRILDALSGLPVRGLLTTGPAIAPESLRRPDNAVVVRGAPHHRVLPDAALVITHGGHGTVIKSLAAGVPLLVLPHGRDQPDNAVRVTARGAGLRLPAAAGTARIRRATARILGDPGYAAAAGRLGTVIRRDSAPDDLLAALESSD